ncbi:MAG: tetratricopeptide repeat protein [Ruminiclostridium sp.]
MMDKLQEMILKAKQLAREDIWNDESIRINAAIIRLDKKNAGAYCRLGRCFEEKGDLLQARKAYKNALILDPKYQGYRNVLDRVDIKIKEEADSVLVEGIKKYREAFDVGMVAKRNGDYTLALKALEKAVYLNPTIYAMTALAASYRAIGELDKAEELYMKVLNKKDNQVAQVGLAAVLKDQGRGSIAKKLLEDILVDDKENEYALRAIGAVYQKGKNIIMAKESFNKAFEIETQQFINNQQ